ncbi:MAG TPA: urea ABC transporter permease subunit UrtB [Polyangia bacterium]|jgi:urea transport system permease protein|nr:urea ABC transporter permease subunit UrtB [Polyangia bacterium]
MKLRRRSRLRFHAIAAIAVAVALPGPRPAAGSTALAATAVSAPITPEVEAAIRGLGATEMEKVQDSATKLGTLGDPRAIPALEALADDRLRVGGNGDVYYKAATGRALHNAVTGAVVSPEPSALRSQEMDNALRRTVLPMLAQLKLNAPDASVRLEAAEELGKRGTADSLPMLRAAATRETDGKVKQALALVIGKADLRSEDPARRLEAVNILGAHGNTSVKSELIELTRKRDDGSFAEPDPGVRAAAQTAIGSIEMRELLTSMLGHLLYGLSLASVLLFAALGLAITFGVMGVINMAHGEMLMLGAYATYSVQVLFQRYLPGYFQWYLLLAVPVAFAVCVAVGIVLETVIVRRLYGRPLETLLATWGISLGLIQTVRLIFGAQNVAVANPDWLAGGKEILHGLVLPYNRMAVVLFVIIVAMLVWVVLQRTRLGLQVRAVTQNRAMAACMGISTSRVDMWTFGLGSGIAGLGGVALSQLGNVGPELGQSYILDSFMVVVVGGVGRIAGTIFAASGLGIINKLLEPFAGAVMGKIVVLAFIILFIQRRPQGLFSVKGRVEA